MHILAGLVALIGVVGVLLWRLHSAAEAAKGLTEAAGEVHGLFRRAAWRRKINKDLLATIDDSRLAAVALMTSLAQSDGAMTEAEHRAILAESREILGADDKLGPELLAHARWLVRDVPDADEVFRRLTPVIVRNCNSEQRAQLLAMLERIAAAEGVAGAAERRTLERLSRALKG